MEIADVGREGDDDFAIDLEDETEHAMGRGMLRTHVNNHGLIGDGILALVPAGRAFDDVLDAWGDHVFCSDGSH